MALLVECEASCLTTGYKRLTPSGVKQKRATFFLTASNAAKAGTQTKSYCKVPILHSVEEEYEVV